MTEILEGNLERAYTEFKDYQSFYNSAEKEFQKDKEEFMKYAFENQDNLEDLLDRQVETIYVPTQHRADLHNLQQRLVTVYNTVKDVLEIPREKRDEIEKLETVKTLYKIEQGKPIDINPTLNKQIKDQVKEQIKAQFKG